jgi:hypothetical protein
MNTTSPLGKRTRTPAVDDVDKRQKTDSDENKKPSGERNGLERPRGHVPVCDCEYCNAYYRGTPLSQRGWLLYERKGDSCRFCRSGTAFIWRVCPRDTSHQLCRSCYLHLFEQAASWYRDDDDDNDVKRRNVTAQCPYCPGYNEVALEDAETLEGKTIRVSVMRTKRTVLEMSFPVSYDDTVQTLRRLCAIELGKQVHLYVPSRPDESLTDETYLESVEFQSLIARLVEDSDNEDQQ